MEVLPLVVKMTEYSEVASGNRQDKVHSDTDTVGPTQLMIEATLSLLNNPRISYFNFNGEEILEFKGLPWWLSGKELACQCRKYRFNPWVRKIPCRRIWKPTPVFLPGKSQ